LCFPSKEAAKPNKPKTLLTTFSKFGSKEINWLRGIFFYKALVIKFILFGIIISVIKVILKIIGEIKC